jgi:hypothetical protein
LFPYLLVPVRPVVVVELRPAAKRIRAERQAIRDFTAHVEAELAAGKSLGEISDPPRP